MTYPRLEFPVCIDCKTVSQIAVGSPGYTLKCPTCGKICEDANAMLKAGTLVWVTPMEQP